MRECLTCTLLTFLSLFVSNCDRPEGNTRVGGFNKRENLISICVFLIILDVVLLYQQDPPDLIQTLIKQPLNQRSSPSHDPKWV